MSPRPPSLRGISRTLLIGTVLLALVFPLVGGRYATAAPAANPLSYLVLAPCGLLDGLKAVEVVADYGKQALYRIPDHVLAALAPGVRAQVTVVGSVAEAEALLGLAPTEPEGACILSGWPGPDGFGYSGQTVSYDWEDISGSGTAVLLGDDAYDGPFGIGFTFNFYGIDYTEFYIASNGYIAFGTGSSDLSDDCPMPNSATPNNIIALMWDDLDPGDTSDVVYYETFASCPVGSGQCLIVHYEDYHHYSTTPPGPVAGTFEAILYESGVIRIQFRDAGDEEGLNSTTGIEGDDALSDHGLYWVCNTAASIGDHDAIEFVAQPDFTLDATPVLHTICAGQDAVYTNTLTALNGFNSPVTLSAAGQPGGTTATFVPNPITPSGVSMLTIGNTGGAAFGLYDITVTGVGGGRTHDDTVQLQVYSGVPAAPTLVSPANGATAVALQPTLTWNAAAQATGYDLQIATDAGFSNVVYSASESTTSHDVTMQLDPETLYYWRVRGTNLCGNGPSSAVWSFTTRAVPPVLLVDDDDDSPDVVSYYTTALDTIGVGYDLWDTGGSDINEPDAATLALYQTVVWFSGDNTGTPGPGATAETDLGNWLDGGDRCFFISSEDYYYNRGLTTFMQTYLGVSSVGSDGGDYTSVTGQGSVYSGLGPYTLDYAGVGLTDYSDYIIPDASAEVGFLGNNSNEAAIDKNGSPYRTTFWGYPFEVISTAAEREEAMRTTLAWCGVLGPDFSLQAGPALRTICTPDDATYNITLTAFAGFNQPVTLAAAGHPGGTTATFSPNPITPSGVSVLTIGSTGAAAAGLYDITVTGVGDGKTHADTVQLEVYTGVPAAPTLVSPTDGATGVALLPTLEWNAVTGATGYYLEVATDAGFINIVYSASETGTSHTLGSSLSGNTWYYWRVQASNICGAGACSAGWSFKTIPGDMTISNDNTALDIFFNCDTAGYNGAFQVQRVGTGQTYHPTDEPGDYGIFVSYDGCVIGPDVVGQTFDDDWATCTDAQITGAGTVADPWVGTASFAVNACSAHNLTLTYTLTYADGDDYYRTDYQVCGGDPGDPFVSYFAADLYMEGSDYGYGYYYSPTYSVGCWRAGPPDQYMFFTPIDPVPADHYQESLYSTIWSVIAAGGDFSDTVDDATSKDTGAGLQYNQTFDASGCATVAAYTSFSHVGIYVDDDYTAATPGWQITHFDSIQDGIDAAGATQLVFVENVSAGPAEEYVESVVLNKDIVVRVIGSMAVQGSLTLQTGRWEAPVGTMSLSGDFTHSGGTFSSGSGTVRFNGGAVSHYSGGPTTFYNVVVDAGTILEIDGCDAPLFDLGGSIINDGGLRQTRDVPNNTLVAFLNISTDKYYGLEIEETGGALNETMVTVYGNQSCPNNPNGGDPTVLRCFEIVPSRVRAADVTFYYRDAEENGQLAPDVYHWNGGSWDLQTFAARDTGGVENNWVRATGISAYSPFGLWGGVTAVKLTSFTAAPTAGGVLLSWETASEHDNAGFNVYRSVIAEALGERINGALIPSQAPGGEQGAAYEFLDTAVVSGRTYYYWLEDVSLSGVRTQHGPLAVGLWQAYLPLVGR